MEEITGVNNVEQTEETKIEQEKPESKKKGKAPVSADTKLRQARAELGKIKKQLAAAEEALTVSDSKNIAVFQESKRVKEELQAMKNNIRIIIETYMSSTQSTLSTTAALYKSLMK